MIQEIRIRREEVAKIITRPITATDTDEMIIDSFLEQSSKCWEHIPCSEVSCRPKKNESFHDESIRLFCTNKLETYTGLMEIFFWSLSILLTLYTGYKYIPEVLIWKIKPHAFSWLPWMILVGIAFIIQIKNGENIWGFGALAASTLVCALVFILSLKYGEKHITRSDTISLIACLILIVLWLWIKNDILALILICLIDAFAFFPTWRKAWKKPQEESIGMYTISSLKSLLSIFWLRNPVFVNWFYPVFLIMINLLFGLYLLWRRKVLQK